MTTREEVLTYCLTFEDTYLDTPFHDDNWVLARYRKIKKHLPGLISGMGFFV